MAEKGCWRPPSVKETGFVGGSRAMRYLFSVRKVFSLERVQLTDWQLAHLGVGHLPKSKYAYSV